jgi:hypothetical protein
VIWRLFITRQWPPADWSSPSLPYWGSPLHMDDALGRPSPHLARLLASIGGHDMIMIYEAGCDCGIGKTVFGAFRTHAAFIGRRWGENARKTPT